MSSNIKVQRICEYCGGEFTARTTVTKCCSDICSKRAYKARKRDEKLQKAVGDTKAIKAKPIADVKEKEFLTVRDVAILLNCSHRTAYRLVQQGIINGVNIAQRKTLIRRTDIDKLFEQSKPIKATTPVTYPIAECYTVKEIRLKYNVSDKALYELIRRNGVPRQKQGRFTYIPKTLIDKILS